MAAVLALAAAAACAGEVRFVGSFGSKAAVLSIDGGDPKTVRVGQRHAGVTVLAVEDDHVTIEVDGRRRKLRRGEHFGARADADSRQRVLLKADPRGHFYSDGSINGGAVRFVVDTGATSIIVGVPEAERLGIDYRKGVVGTLQTANGTARGWRVSLDRVRVGGIELQRVDAVVTERAPDVALLGMSFLNRLEMQREGETMTLTRRY